MTTIPLPPQRAIDHAFAALLRRMGGNDLVAASGALASSVLQQGDACLDLATWSDAETANGFALPTPDAWTEQLRGSDLVGDGSAPTPLVLTSAGRLYLYRYWKAEHDVAASIRARLANGTDALLATGPLFQKHVRDLFPGYDGPGGSQARAALQALSHRFALICGGPGTGKTYTIGRILALMLQQDPTCRIALTAPTGKAAQRMSEAIAGQIDALPVDDALRARIPTKAQTLHRLLGTRPHSATPRHNREHRLPLDLLVVDEVSMVDLLMMQSMLAALPDQARVLLVGDPDQLASVEAGGVLADIRQAAEGLLPSPVASLVQQTLGQTLPSSDEAPALCGALGRLDYNFRSETHPGIGLLADAVLQGRGTDALALLADGQLAEISWLEEGDPADVAWPHLHELLHAMADPRDALERQGTARILCALREGTRGVSGMNDAIERKRRALGRGSDHGRPVLITANDPGRKLFNGDLGMLLRDDEGQALVWFPNNSGAPFGILPGRMPAHDTAWAMTIHKSQGSEFGAVVVVLPEKEHPLLSRELLYTAITRAREKVVLVGPRAALLAAIARPTRRASGLRNLL